MYLQKNWVERPYQKLKSNPMTAVGQTTSFPVRDKRVGEDPGNEVDEGKPNEQPKNSIIYSNVY